MEALNQIYMAPNIRTLTKITILNNDFALFCLMKRDGVNRMIPLAKRDISELDIQDMSQKIINRRVLTRFVGNLHVYQAPESSCCSCCSCNLSTRSTVQFINIFTSEFFEDYSCKIIVVQ